MVNRVSVIIPFYNNATWLCEAVDSVIKQTYPNLEILVVNDGSKEDIENVLLNFGDKIRYFYKKNGGPGSARNYAMQFVTGDYIAYLDSDDIWMPDKLEKQITFMEYNNLYWSHTGYYNWFPKSNRLAKKNNKYDYGAVYQISYVSLRIQTPALIVKKEVFDNHQDICFPNMRYGQDSYMFSQIAKHYPLGLLRDRLVKIRQRGTNADLRGDVRLRVKSELYKSVVSNAELDDYIKFIYNIYNIHNKFFDIIKKYSGSYLQNLFAKLLWILPFCLERFYKLYFVIKNKPYEYYNKTK